MRCAPLLLVLLASACGAAAAPPTTTTAPASCEDVLQRYRARLAAATNACTTDADCGIYGGLDPDAVCGGSTDRATAEALEALESESAAAGCPVPGYSCPPIAPRCDDGVCR